MSSVPNIEDRIRRLDLRLFSTIDTQSTEADRLCWLAIQRSVRESENGYVYLEIGSHLGGSLQQHLVDPKCRKMYSIDKRPAEQPDDRGQSYAYPDNSTARMIANLTAVAAVGIDRLVCFDSSTAELTADAIDIAPDFCFIDGEHTRAAAFADFEFCLQVVAPNGVIAFHDDIIVRPAIEQAVASLYARKIPFSALKMGGSTFAIFLRASRAAADPAVAGFGVDGRSWLLAGKLTRLEEKLPLPLRHVAKAFLSRLV